MTDISAIGNITVHVLNLGIRNVSVTIHKEQIIRNNLSCLHWPDNLSILPSLFG